MRKNSLIFVIKNCNGFSLLKFYNLNKFDYKALQMAVPANQIARGNVVQTDDQIIDIR